MKRRSFMKELGLAPATLPFLTGLPGLALGNMARPKKRLLFVFTPNGTIAEEFWPQGLGRYFRFGRILEPLEPYRNRMLILKGVSNLVKGPGNAHVRGMGCLLTGCELNPGNIGDPNNEGYAAHGWSRGISIDQELRDFLQGREETRTRFGSLEFGVGVPDRAEPTTRLCYRGNNQPLAPVNDPYEMFRKLYRSPADRENFVSVLDLVREDLMKVAQNLGSEDRVLLERNATLVREMEQNLLRPAEEDLSVPRPRLRDAVANRNDNLPALSRMQTDLLVNAFANDMARVATLQFSKSTGDARMRWLGIEERHHRLSHESDDNADAQEKLVRINRWFSEQLRYLLDQLANTPEPGQDGTLLDHTTVVCINELGKGNTHSLHYLPIVIIGGDMGFRLGRSLRLDWRPRQMDFVSHHRLLLALAHGMGHRLEWFGDEELSVGGPMDLSSYTMSEFTHDAPAGTAMAGMGFWAWRRKRRKTKAVPPEDS